MEEYLQRVIFYKKRPFTKAVFQQFMFDESQPYEEMLALARSLKKKHKLKIIAVNNEAPELNLYRIKKYKLSDFIDAFISSSFVQLRKPDKEIFLRAMQIAQAPAEQIVYIENTPMFVEVAKGLGIQGILHKNYKDTCLKLSNFGF